MYLTSPYPPRHYLINKTMIRLYLKIMLFFANKHKKNWKDLPKCNPDYVDNYKVWGKWKLYIPYKWADAIFIGENVHKHTFYREEYVDVRLNGNLYHYINNRFICKTPDDYKIWNPMIDKWLDDKLLILKDRFSR